VTKPPPQLRRPPRKLHNLALETQDIDPLSLFRISGHSSGEPYFGRLRAYRFDDNNKVKGKRFGTCYLGFDIKTAIAESLLHDEIPQNGRFKLAYKYIESRYLVRFKGEKLTVAVMLGEQLKILGANGSISTILPYSLPQLWSVSIHNHPQKVDGMLYVSRHLNNRNAVVIFDRAKHKLVSPRYEQLIKDPYGVTAMKELKIDFPY
jgi:RES domain